MMKVEIYIKPLESPSCLIEDTTIRINYCDQWVDFRDGKIRITKDPQNEGKQNG